MDRRRRSLDGGRALSSGRRRARRSHRAGDGSDRWGALGRPPDRTSPWPPRRGPARRGRWSATGGRRTPARPTRTAATTPSGGDRATGKKVAWTPQERVPVCCDVK